MTEITNLALYLAEKYGIIVNKGEAKLDRSIDIARLKERIAD